MISVDSSSEMACSCPLQHHHQPLLSAYLVSNWSLAKTYDHPLRQLATIAHLAWPDSSAELGPASIAKSISPSSFTLAVAIESRAVIADAFAIVVADFGLAATIAARALAIAVAAEGPGTGAAAAAVGRAWDAADKVLEKKDVTLLVGWRNLSLRLRFDTGAEEVEAVVEALSVFLEDIKGQSWNESSRRHCSRYPAHLL